jgi:hypothetical protein
MRARFGSTSKFDAARDMLLALDRRISQSPLPAPALWTYGSRSHRLLRDCRDVQLAAPERDGLERALHPLAPKGLSPLIAALESVLGASPGPQSEAWVVFTDGTDNCGRDACEWSGRLAAPSRRPRIYVVGLALTGEDARALRCLSEATSGLLVNLRPEESWEPQMRRLAAILQNLGILRIETALAPGEAAELQGRVYLENADAPLRAIRVERDEELPAGTYKITLETLPTLTFQHVQVHPGGRRTLVAFDLGRLVVRALSPANAPVPAYALLTPLGAADGTDAADAGPESAEAYVAAGRPMFLRAGAYRLAVEVEDSLALQETIDLQPGELRVLTVGGTGFLRAEATGFPELGEVEVQLQDYVSGRSSDFFPWKQALPVPAGKYRAVVRSLPLYVHENLTFAPAETTVLALRGLGMLRVDLRDSGGRPLSVPVTLIRPGSGPPESGESSPAILGTFVSGVKQAVLAGTYDLLLETVPSLVERGVRIRQGTARVLTLALPAATSAEGGT